MITHASYTALFLYAASKAPTGLETGLCLLFALAALTIFVIAVREKHWL